jgi:hypothetical protein
MVVHRSLVAAVPVAFVVAACSSSPFSSSGASGSTLGGFPGCKGVYNTQPSPTGQYVATDFGCSSNPYFTDPTDACGSAACIQSAYDEGVCSTSQTHASCQRTVNWYSIGGARYGCGTRLLVTNPKNQKSVVVMVLDNGPSCYVENKAGYWVLDVSYPTIKYLFGEEKGYSDHAMVQADVVDSSTPLGPTDGSVTQPPPPPTDDAGDDATVDDAGDDAGTGVSCSTDGDCNPGIEGSGEICVNGTCVPGCNADWQCPGITLCIDGQCQ